MVISNNWVLNAPTTPLFFLWLHFSKYTLQYVDTSFYQTKRGLFLPFAVGTSLSSSPSLPILFACVVVTVDFFVGVFFDAVSVNMIGVSFGVAPLSKVPSKQKESTTPPSLPAGT
ncbi:hypothetical protein BKA70DRAFT_1325997 [Coprinopsis sp. MPI-PUGE-AT-0042]|nr:hypothetical protein BKA70DRAFT_1325997 [Coprinopsis sp. MPI-PUGE-AT-0042]